MTPSASPVAHEESEHHHDDPHDEHNHHPEVKHEEHQHQDGDHTEGEHKEPGHQAGDHAEGEHGEHEEAGHEGEVQLTEEQQKLSGILTEKLNYRQLTPSVRLPATLAPDSDLEAQISSRAIGVIAQLLVRQGDQVSVGQVVAVVESPEVAQLRSQFKVLRSSTQLAQSNLERRLSLSRLGDTTRRPYEEAQRELAQARNGLQSALANFDLQKQKLERLQDLEKDGIAAKQLVDEAKAAFREASARVSQAQLDLRVAQDHMKRESRLSSSGVLRDNEAYQAQAELTRNQKEQEAAAEILSSYGANPDGLGGEVAIKSPLSGIITERPKSLGEQVAVGEAVMQVVDTSHLWAWIDLNQELLSTLRIGLGATLTSQEVPKEKFVGTLTWINTVADPETKKVRARLELRNQSQRLRPNGLAEVTLNTGKTRQVLALPRAAVVSVENKSVVYVQEEPGHYQRHPVEVGVRQDDWVEIRDGLKAGETVVTKGALALQAADLKSLMGGAGGHEH